MSFFAGCTSLVSDESNEFVVSSKPYRIAGGPQVDQGAPPSSALFLNTNQEGSIGGPLGAPTGPLGSPRGPQGGPLGAPLRGPHGGPLGAPLRGPPATLDPQKIGRVLTVAVSELGEQVKSGI